MDGCKPLVDGGTAGSSRGMSGAPGAGPATRPALMTSLTSAVCSGLSGGFSLSPYMMARISDRYLAHDSWSCMGL